MRAKLIVQKVTQHQGFDVLSLAAVTSGTAEDNTFAKHTPCASMELTVTNPDLIGKFKPGDKYYADFTLAES